MPGYVWTATPVSRSASSSPGEAGRYHTGGGFAHLPLLPHLLPHKPVSSAPAAYINEAGILRRKITPVTYQEASKWIGEDYEIPTGVLDNRHRSRHDFPCYKRRRTSCRTSERVMWYGSQNVFTASPHGAGD